MVLYGALKVRTQYVVVMTVFVVMIMVLVLVMFMSMPGSRCVYVVELVFSVMIVGHQVRFPPVVRYFR